MKITYGTTRTDLALLLCLVKRAVVTSLLLTTTVRHKIVSCKPNLQLACEVLAGFDFFLFILVKRRKLVRSREVKLHLTNMTNSAMGFV